MRGIEVIFLGVSRWYNGRAAVAAVVVVPVAAQNRAKRYDNTVIIN